MEVTIIGCGYVGLVTATCLASIGHMVRGVEKDAQKLKTQQEGHCPIFEAMLADLMKEQCRAGRLRFARDVSSAVRDAEMVFLCVGSPPKPDGTVDLSYLDDAVAELGEALQGRIGGHMMPVVVKSTVPPGTSRRISRILREKTKANIEVVDNPEFLREGSAVKDFLEPERIVIGTESPDAMRMMRRLYDPVIQRPESFLTMNWESAELTKYAANAMLAARISFMNEMTILCEGYGADIEAMRQALGLDHRIGPWFLKGGVGYGGSCFPKDVAALEHISRNVGYESLFVRAILAVNSGQKTRFFQKLVAKLGRPIRQAQIAVWGLAFKAETDDIRESPAIDIIRYLIEAQAHVRATDPKAIPNMKRVFGDRVEWCEDPMTAATDADAVAILTDWPQYCTLSYEKVAAVMKRPVLFDGRNCLHPEMMKEAGFEYHSMGRPAVDRRV